MEQTGKFSEEYRHKAFTGYSEYMDYIFACANIQLAEYIQGLKSKYATGQGGYKNIMYPDIEIAYQLCDTKIQQFFVQKEETAGGKDESGDDVEDEYKEEIDDELADLLQGFAMSFGEASDRKSVV